MNKQELIEKYRRIIMFQVKQVIVQILLAAAKMLEALDVALK